MDRETLGRIVRAAWVEYCQEIGDTKPSHVAPWEELSERDKEADRRIGEAVKKEVAFDPSKPYAYIGAHYQDGNTWYFDVRTNMPDLREALQQAYPRLKIVPGADHNPSFMVIVKGSWMRHGAESGKVMVFVSDAASTERVLSSFNLPD